MRNPVVLVLCLTVFVWTMGYQSLYATWNYFTIERFGWTPAQVGWSLGAVGVTGAIVQGVLSRRLIPRFGPKRIIVAGVLSAIMGYGLYAFAGAGWMMYLGIVVSALQGLVFPSLQGIMSAGVAPSEQGELQGSLSSVQSLSSIFGPPLMTHAFAWGSASNGPLYLPGAPFVLAMLFSLLTLIIFIRAIAMGAGASLAEQPAGIPA